MLKSLRATLTGVLVFAGTAAIAQVPITLPNDGALASPTMYNIESGNLFGLSVATWAVDIAFDPSIVEITAAGLGASSTAAGCFSVFNLDYDSCPLNGAPPFTACARLGAFFCNNPWPDANPTLLATITVAPVAQGSTELICDNVDPFLVDATGQTIEATCANGDITTVAQPVELVEFTAAVENDDIVLNWNTASETNNAGFQIEHARGDVDFAEIGYVEGHGNTTEAKSYTFRATGLDIGRHRFRLKQIDFDGAFEYHPVVEATIELVGTHRLGAAYPNPFNPSTTFELIVSEAQNIQIDVLNALGQRVDVVYKGVIEAQEPTNYVWQASSLPTGLYFYRVVGETFHQTRQMLLVK